MAEIIQNEQSPKKSSQKVYPKLNWRLNILITLVVILAAGGWLTYNHFKSTYTIYNLKSGQSGSGMAFDRPAKDSTILYSQTGQVELADTTTANKANSVIVAVISPTSKAPYTASQLKSISSIFSSVNNPLYVQYSSPLGAFVSGRFPASTPITYTALTPFTNPTIKQNAWQMSLTATGRDSAGKATQLKGKMVYTITNHGYYYFMFYTSAAKWASSQATWTHVLNSLKVDQ